MIADEHPELVRSLTLIDCPATVMGKDDYHRALERFAIPDMNELLVPDQPSVLPICLRSPTIAAASQFAWRDAHHHLFTEHRAKRVEPLDDLSRTLRPVPNKSHPVLILWGEHDVVSGLAGATPQRTPRRPAQLEIIPNTAHAPIVEAPKTINRSCFAFSPVKPRAPSS